MINKTTTPQIMFVYFIVGAIVSNLIVYYLSDQVLRVKCTLDELKEEAAKDYLTGLNNVRNFDKSFNDTYGHSSGDAVLKELSDILRKSVRDFDVVGRVGGEEFSIILRDCGKERSKEIAERIRKNVEQNIFILPCGTAIKITVSIGIAVYPATIADLNLLKEKADEKLYESKHIERNKICV